MVMGDGDGMRDDNLLENSDGRWVIGIRDEPRGKLAADSPILS
jgi:hypothetical protein